jgi:N-acetyl-anhydromuramyl-L-alanine amidase AmpD
MRDIHELIIHCSYTYPEMDIGAAEIRSWHMNENGWSDIGYHYVIRRNGAIENGRPEAVVGAHTSGHNSNSIGICMVGGKAHNNWHVSNYTAAQWVSLYKLVTALIEKYPGVDVYGHYEYSDTKTCPNFDVDAWAETL